MHQLVTALQFPPFSAASTFASFYEKASTKVELSISSNSITSLFHYFIYNWLAKLNRLVLMLCLKYS